MTSTICYYIPLEAEVPGHGWRVSVVEEGKPGHHPTGDWPYRGKPGERMPLFWGPTYEDALERAYVENSRMGITRERTDQIVQSSIGAQIKRRTRRRRVKAK